MTKARLLILLLAGSVLLGACDNDNADSHADKLLSKRIAIFKQMTRALAPLGLVARGRTDYNRAEFVWQVQQLQQLSSQPWALFGPDGNYPPTRAKPEVWSQADQFKQAQQQYLAAVEQLSSVAGSADMAAIKAAVTEVEQNCNNCHRQFRNK